MKFRLILAGLVAAAGLCFLMMIVLFPAPAKAAAVCPTIEYFVETQSEKFPDLVVTKLSDAKAKVLIAFLGKFSPKAGGGDTALVGTFNYLGKDHVGVAIFKLGCLVYIESATATEWAAAKPVIFGPEV